jgi:hypothetical protein
MSLFGTPVPMYPFVPVIDADYTGAIDSTAALTNAQNSLKLLGKYGTLSLGSGTLIINDFNWHPGYNIVGPGKRLLTIKATTAVAAVIICKALLPNYADLTGSGAYAPIISDLSINGGNLTNVDGIYVPNAANDDPNFPANNNSKGYSSIRAFRLVITNCGGNGIKSEANRHRFYAEDCFIISNGKSGIVVGGSDPVVGARCGLGSNGSTGNGYALHFNQAGGCIVEGTNMWGPGNNRNDSALAFKATDCNGVLVVGNVFNDTLYISATDATTRSCNICGNQFRPLETMFSANGVPIGTGTSASNCFIYIVTNDMVTVVGNDFNLVNKTGFTFDYILNARNGAQVFFQWYASITTNEKTWANVSSIPYSASGVGPDGAPARVVGWGADIGNGVIRLGDGSGSVIINGGPGFDPLAAGNIDTFGVIFADPADRPMDIRTPAKFSDMLAYRLQTATIASASINVNAASNRIKFNGAGAGPMLVTLPAPTLDGQTIKFSCAPGCSVTAFTWALTAPATTNVDLPATMAASTGFEICYTASGTKWQVLN